MILRWSIVPVVLGGDQIDVGLDVPAGTTLAQVWEGLVLATGRSGTDEIAVAGRRALTPDDVVGRYPLLDGTEIALVPSGWPLADAEQVDAPVSLVAVSGPDAGRSLPLRPGLLVLGRHRECDLVVADPDVSRRQCEVEVSPGGVGVRDLSLTNRTLVQPAWTPGSGMPMAVPIPHGSSASISPTTVPLGGSILIGSTRLEVRLSSTVRDGDTAQRSDGTVEHIPATRRRTVEVARVVTIPPPPVSPIRRRIPWLAALAPIAASIAVAIWWGSPIFLLMGLLGPVIVVGSVVGDRRDNRRTAARDTADHLRQTDQARGMAAAAAADVLVTRLAMYPDPATVLALATGRSPQLWQRTGEDDNLVVRVAIGSMPSSVRLDLTSRLSSGATSVDPEVQLLTDAPLTVDLRQGCAVVGREGWRAALSRAMVGRAVVQSGPDQLSLLVLAGSPAAAERWAWTRWLPHASGQDPLLVESPEAALASLSVARERSGRLLVVVDDVAAADLSDGSTPGDHERPGPALLVLADPGATVPHSCAATVSQIGESGTGVRVETPDGEVSGIADGVGPWLSVRLARALAPLRAATGATTGLPREVWLPTLLRGGQTMAGPPAATEIGRWWRSADDGLSVPLLWSAGGPVDVDLVRDGPHALIGGTTGSGKSELLRSLVVGLACRYAPSEVSFLLVDFKGGATLADCAELPHAIGLLTDLDPYEARRVLTGIRAEVARRERLLSHVGVADIAAFRRLRTTTAMPRLVCVVDEFRVLAEQAPDVLDGLVHVAAVGRSLGVHLVLATQRPGGIVSPDIRANTALRIALRVQDVADSRDVIDSADAATLPRDRPGRAVVRQDGHVLTVQTACVEADGGRDAEVRVWRVDPREPVPAYGVVPDRTGHETTRAIVASCVAAAAAADLAPVVAPWLAPLPATVRWADVRAAHVRALGTGRPSIDDELNKMDSPVLPLALADLPGQQRRADVMWRPGADGHLVILGGPGSGRTTALAGLLAAAAQAGAPTVALSSGPRAGWPTTTAVVDWRDVDLLDDVLAGLTSAVARPASTREGTDAGQAWTVVAVDDCDALLQCCADHPATLERLVTLTRDATAMRVALALAGGRGLGSGRLATGGRLRVLLRPADPLDASLIGVHVRDLPRVWPPGRGLVSGYDFAGGGDVAAGSQTVVEVQISLPDTAEHDVAMSQRAPATPGADFHFRLPAALPRRLAVTELAATTWPAITLGVTGDAMPAVVEATARPGVVIAGPPSSGRTTTLRAIAWQAVRDVTPVVVLTASSHEWDDLAASGAVRVTDDATRARALIAEGGPQLVIIDDLDLLTADADDLAADIGDMSAAAGTGLAVGSSTHHLANQFRGYAALVRRHGSALLLHPGRHDARDVLAAVAPTQASTLPGRGLLVTRGRVRRVQVAVAPASWPGAPPIGRQPTGPRLRMSAPGPAPTPIPQQIPA